MVNHIAIVLNFSRSVVFRFALTEPIVIRMIPVSIMVACSIPKKPDLPLMYRVLKIVKKIRHNRADKIQPQTDDQLHMRDGRGDVPHIVIKP